MGSQTASCRNPHVPHHLVLQRPGRVLNSRSNPFRRNTWVRTLDVSLRGATGEELENELNAAPCAANAGSPAEHLNQKQSTCLPYRKSSNPTRRSHDLVASIVSTETRAGHRLEGATRTCPSS